MGSSGDTVMVDDALLDRPARPRESPKVGEIVTVFKGGAWDQAEELARQQQRPPPPTMVQAPAATTSGHLPLIVAAVGVVFVLAVILYFVW